MADFKQEYHSFIETFVDWEDAILWAEHRLKPYKPDEWELEVRIKTLNGGYRVSVTAVNRQEELFEFTEFTK